MNYYNEIKNKLIDNEIYNKVKDYSKEKNKIITYFEIGKLLYEAGSKYGENIIGEYAKKLIIEVGKKYNERTLRRMRQFFIKFENEKWSTMSTKLTWSHYTEILPIKDRNKFNYYLNICEKENLNIRSLRNKIKNKEYERLPEDTKSKLSSKKEIGVRDLIKNPILIKNSNHSEIISEKVLQRLILENIPSFLKELGHGFTFIENEYKIKYENTYNSIDLLLFNIDFNCYVVVELKVTELKKQHIGQIEIYMNYIDKNLKKVTQNKTIGIIISKKNKKFVIEFCSDKRIIAKEYELINI